MWLDNDTPVKGQQFAYLGRHRLSVATAKYGFYEELDIRVMLPKPRMGKPSARQITDDNKKFIQSIITQLPNSL